VLGQGRDGVGRSLPQRVLACTPDGARAPTRTMQASRNSLIALALTALTPGLSTAQVNDTCVETMYTSDNGGNVGGAIYFDVSATELVSISGLRTNIGEAVGTPVSLDVYTTNGTSFGAELNGGAWGLVASSSSESAGEDNPTQFLFNTPFWLPATTTGIALVVTGGHHEYTNGTPTNTVHSSADGVLTVTANGASNLPFGGILNQTRVWNGDFCYDAGSANRVTTQVAGNIFGGIGGAVYFDLTTTRTVTFSSLEAVVSGAVGAPVGMRVFTTPGSHAGKLLDQGAWTLVAHDDGASVSAGPSALSTITLDEPFSLPAGTFGIALIAQGVAHRYVLGTGANQTHVSPDGVLTLAAGSAANVPFQAASTPRVWCGRLAYDTPNNCVKTPFAANNGGPAGGAVYFDVVASMPVTIYGLTTNTADAGALVGMEVWTKPGTYVGSANNAAAWNLATVDDGSSVAAERDEETLVRFNAPLVLPAGRTGIALVLLGVGHDYTNGGNVFTSADGVLLVESGAASGVPFGATIANRTWNGSLCYAGEFVGVNFCGPAVPNSTGSAGQISAVGSTSVAANDLRLIARRLPLGSSGFFLTSPTNGFVPFAGGAQGNLCIAGPSIGRYVGPGQVKNSGLSGSFSLDVDLTQHPTPLGFVPVAPGETWNFQCWYRDANPLPTSNFTDALQIMFQ
jgi:hypothetical protein